MKILKNILIGLGRIFALLVVIFIFISFKSVGFKDEYSPFVTEFMAEFSQNWEIGDVQYMLSNDFIEQIDTPNGRQVMVFFRQLGKIQNIQDIELKNFKTFTGTNSYKSGEFVFKAEFENASGLVRMTVIVNKDGERVKGLHINPTTEVGMVPPRAEI